MDYDGFAWRVLVLCCVCMCVCMLEMCVFMYGLMDLRGAGV